MIIKSLSRKRPTFEQLISYLDEDGKASDHMVLHNLFSDGRDRKALVREFADNAEHLPPRRRGTYLYHEILALEGRSEIAVTDQAAALYAIAQQYLLLRAPNRLAYGRIHLDTDHPHLHLVVSSNQPRSSRRERLSKATFRRVQTDVERFVLEQFPELQERMVYGHDPARTRHGPRAGTREYEVARREGRAPLRYALRELLAPEFDAARSHQELASAIDKSGYLLYQRGRSWGIQNKQTGRRHRLKTLGLEQEFVAAHERFALIQNRTSDIAHIGDRSQGERDADRDHKHDAQEHEQ